MTLAMFDFNDVFTPPERYDLDEVKARLCARAAEWIPGLFPQAQISRDKQTLRCADLSGRPPRKEGSCTIYLSGPRAGWGFDWATNESAGPIDLIHHATGYSGAKLFEEAAHLARMDMPVPLRAAAPSKPDHSLEIARIKSGCEPVAGTIGESYLVSRGLKDPGCPDLLFHPDLTDFDSKRGWSGLVAIVRNADGTLTGGIHRTFLLDDGSGKAPADKSKKMLGQNGGGAVQLMPMLPDGRLGIAEGIETALSAHAIFGIPTWAALSAGNVKDWKWPEGVREVTIFRDAGEAGEQSAAGLAMRLSAAGIAHTIVAPLHGDDFNDDLRKGAKAEDYPKSDTPRSTALRTLQEFETAARALTKPPDVTEVGRILGQLVLAELDPLTERQVMAIVKEASGIPVSILTKQVDDLRRRVVITGDVNHRPLKPRWFGQLRLDMSGTPERNEANIMTALSNDEVFAGAIAFNEFTQEIEVVRPLPWDDRPTFDVRAWTEADDVEAAVWLQHRNINVSPGLVSRTAATYAKKSPYHPVRDYLKSLKWDGTPRLERWAATYLGAEDTRLHRAFGALWMISAVARIMEPGAKTDHIIVLEGVQGAGKSTALKVLAGENWFTDDLAEISSKDAAQQLRGVWIIEIGELDVIGRAEVSRIKAFATRTVDRYRPPYERYVIEVPRQCVFAGTVNHDAYLRDETGNRRFWPVKCGAVDIAALRRDRDQLGAEATFRHGEGAVWWLTDPELIAEAGAAQEARFQSDAWDDLIERWLVVERKRVNHGYGFADDWREEDVPRDEPIIDVSVSEILKGAIGLDPGRWTRADQMRVGAYLKRNRWDRYQKRSGSLKEWRYRRPFSSA